MSIFPPPTQWVICAGRKSTFELIDLKDNAVQFGLNGANKGDENFTRTFTVRYVNDNDCGFSLSGNSSNAQNGYTAVQKYDDAISEYFTIAHFNFSGSFMYSIGSRMSLPAIIAVNNQEIPGMTFEINLPLYNAFGRIFNEEISI